jgi:hypothetical protein
MRISKKTMTSMAALLAVISTDVAGAAASTAGLAAGAQDEARRGAQRGEIRRPSRALCAGVGIVLGLVAGAIFGRSRRNGGDGFSGTAAAVGGIGSALICNAIRWRSVRREDQEEVTRKVAAMTLESSPTQQTYRSPVTGETYTITPGEVTYRENNDTQYTTIADVDLPQRGYKISTVAYQVNTAVLNLRATPGSETSDRITGAFYHNDMVETLSETPDGQWVLVAYDGVGYGWVSRRYLVPASVPYGEITFARPASPQQAATAAAAASAPPPPPPRATPRRGRRARPAAPPPRPRTLILARMTTVPLTRTVQVRGQQMPCRAMAVANQQNQSDRRRSCVGAGGLIRFT